MPGDDQGGRDAYRSFGAYLRSQRQLAQLTLRQLAELSSISNPYLSQIERGLHQPSIAVIRSIADALNLSADALLAQVAGLEDDEDAAAAPPATEAAIRADPLLTASQKSALLSVYRSLVGQAEQAAAGEDNENGPPGARQAAVVPEQPVRRTQPAKTSSPGPEPEPAGGRSKGARSRRGSPARPSTRPRSRSGAAGDGPEQKSAKQGGEGKEPPDQDRTANGDGRE